MNPEYISDKADPSDPLAPGLYLVATPIGNLEDITLRALRILRECDLVAAEDTRRVRILLNNFDIKVRTLSYREQNRAQATPELIDAISAGGSVALVSDAGTPCVSDPGAELVAACVNAGLPVFTIPGPSAATSALAVSGIQGDRFSFLGFLPSRTGQRKRALEEIRERGEPLIFFEAPHRIIPSLQDTLEVLGDRRAVAVREMTKIYEERIGETLSQLIENLNNRSHIRGEFTIVVDGAQAAAADLSEAELGRRYRTMLAEGIEPNEALKRLAAATGRSKRELYKLLRRG